jgi:arsenate reductase
MAEALLKYLYIGQYEVYSAGVEPTKVNPYAIEVLKEFKIDISKNKSKSIVEFRDISFDYVITVCDNAKENCPFFPGKKIIHKNFENPADIKGSTELKLNFFRKIRDDIKSWIVDFFGELKA